MNKEILLKLDEVVVHYGGVKALDSVSVELDEGEIVALMGPNGAGKSTVLKAIFGLTTIQSGRVVWREEEYRPVPHQVVQMGVSFVPQGRRVFKYLTVYENLEMGGFVIKNKKELKRRIEEILDFFPVLREKAGKKSGTLSGGQQQMLALARGMITDPKVLLLDEPSLGLAPKIVKEVFVKIREINEKRKTAIMVVEHNIKSLLEIADRAYVLNQGKVAAKGPAEEIENSDILEKVFMGRLGE